jgi:DNA repair photolyase
MFGPLLPFLSDGPESIDDLFQKAADLRIDVIWVDALNARPRVWPSVSRLLNKKFPELLSSYRAVLFEHSEREAYLNQLRSYIIRAAKKFRLTDRLAGYP